jgi:hypothetical protein
VHFGSRGAYFKCYHHQGERAGKSSLFWASFWLPNSWHASPFANIDPNSDAFTLTNSGTFAFTFTLTFANTDTFTNTES